MGKDKISKEEAKNKGNLERANRIIGNDLENIPTSLIVYWTAAIASSSPSSSVKPEWIQKLMIAFTIARIAFTILYASGIPVVRSLAFMISFAATMSAAISTLRG